MKFKTLFIASLLAFSAHAGEIPELPNQYVEKFTRVIWIIEGAEKARKPYGVLSVKVNNKEEAKKVVINSIRNNWKRWHKAGKPDDFIIFFARRWCPSSADPVGHKNWVKNAKFYMNK